MRLTLLPLIAAVALVAGPGDAADAQTRRAPAKAAKPAEPPQPLYEPEGQMKTSDQMKRESVGGAVTTPLRDLNVTRTDIPDVLLQALTDPYARPPRKWNCRTLIAMVQPFDDVLGPDIDQIPANDDSRINRGTAMGAAADFASSALIPFRGVVRTLTGAEKHDKLVQAAIVAGHTRRAYLKGLGEAKGCPPPATPSHERAGAAPAVQKGLPLTPKYPIRPSGAQQTRNERPPPVPPKPRT